MALTNDEEILTFLLQTLGTGTEIINHKNYSGNTPLHWAALNTHLECVKALVGAGVDISIKNDAGLDAVFLAERSAWSVDEEESQGQKADGEGEGKEEGNGKMSPGREVVEWLLSCETNEGDGEEGNEEGNEAAEGDGNN